MGVGVDSLVTVDDAGVGDLDDLAGIERRSFATPWSKAQLRNELRFPFSRLRVARDGDALVRGYLCRWEIAGEIQIFRIAVEPDWRRLSVGRLLLNDTLDRARRSSGRVLLEVDAGNDSALRLYRSAGFRETGRRRGYYPSGRDALLLDLDELV